MMNYFSETTSVAKLGTDVEETSNQFLQVLNGILGNKSMIVMIVAFSVTIILVYIIRRTSINYSWRIAIAVGAISLIVCILIGDLTMDTQMSLFGVIVSTLVSAVLMLVVEFFAFNVDYARDSVLSMILSEHRLSGSTTVPAPTVLPAITTVPDTPSTGAR